ncbi:MAG TPA: DUF4384 domain-containing protein [Pyrinomonadaceae bacterium]|jgi:hypothetical protein
MHTKSAYIFLLACVALSATGARAQDVVRPEEEVDESLTVRGVFFATRPGGSSKKSSTGSTSATNRTSGTGGGWSAATGGAGGSKSGAGGSADGASVPTKNSGVVKNSGGAKRPGGASKGQGAASASKSVKASGVKSASASKAVVPAPGSIGLGYTLYMRDASGGAVRVDPARSFRAGEQIRIALETNSDGYLYIFHTENGSNPQMLYPDVRLNGGTNAVRAHVPYQVPSSLNDWFKFDANAATERLYIVVARKPLAGIPFGEELKRLIAERTEADAQASVEQLAAGCSRNPEPCVWRPTPTLWAQVSKASSEPAVLEKSTVELGQLQTSNEREATVRGISLSQDEPAPSVVRMSASSNSNLLVTVIDLVHK